MMDQRNKFLPMGILTEFVAEQSDEEAVKRVLNGQTQLVYISPESIIGNRKFRQMLLSPVYKKHLVAFVVDEAHCVKTWYVTSHLTTSQRALLACMYVATIASRCAHMHAKLTTKTGTELEMSHTLQGR